MNHNDVEELNNKETIAEECCCQSESGNCECSEKKCCDNKSCECSGEKETLTAEIERLTAENNALIEKVKLAQAELINYRRRKDEETTNLLKYANQDLILELIALVDNFERAIKLDDNDLTDDLSKFLAGFKMMYASLTETLRKFGVEEINRPGQAFDPSQEQALMTDHVDGMEDDIVIEVLLKGYKLKDRVIRPASVKINQN